MDNAHNINNLEPLAISELLNKQFFIPHYQRGYRWTEHQVEQLLEDIDSFDPREIPGKPGEKTFYCLQPVVVKLIGEDKKRKLREKNIVLDGEWYEVIDGQQRLTTILIILQYINQKWKGEDKENQFLINYETRNECVDFLNNLKVNKDDTVDINKSNIDFYHMSAALHSIRQWQLTYSNKNGGKTLNTAGFQSTFLYSAKVIWYQVSDTETDGRPLFERLNLGKIPLTNAELTKALFLSSESFKNLPLEEKRIKQYEIAHLWDEIEHKLNESDLKFWSFITNKERENFETKIDLLLDLISGKTDQDKDPFFTFLSFTKKQKEGSLLKIWEEIEHFYFTISQWFMEKEYYHKIGYLVTARPFSQFKGINLGQLVKDSMNIPKSVFMEQINNKIKESVRVELSELRYENHHSEIFNVLLLFNVEIYRTSEAVAEFYPFKQHKSNIWSLEHIHARNSENFDKSKRDPWNEWLKMHKTILLEISNRANNQEKELSEQLILEIEQFNNEQLTWEHFSNLFNKINDFFTLDSESFDRDSEGVSNLALLSQPDNSALKNSVFEIKRREIIKLDKAGSFIPIGTRRAFLKYYRKENNPDQNYFWSTDDRKAYYSEMHSILKDYLPINHIEQENDEN